MTERWRTWLTWGKAILGLLIIAGVVVFFARLLEAEELRQAGEGRSPGEVLGNALLGARWNWLLVTMGLYVLGLTAWAGFWALLLRWAGEPLPVAVALRACYLSHLGKYAPLGKGWALLLRVGLAVQAGVKASTAAVTCAYETLTCMASGALVASAGNPAQLGTALVLLGLAGLPLLPRVFNFLVERVARRFGSAANWPRLGYGSLLTGLALTTLGWALLGASLAALLVALGVNADSEPLALWGSCTAWVAISYVAGFVAATPGGLGVRELVLQQLLAPSLGVLAVVVVVLLRVLWTVAELALAGVIYWWPPTTRRA